MEKLLSMLEGVPEVQFGAGEVLIQEGQPMTKLFVLKDGEVQVTVHRTPVAQVTGTGAVLGEVSALLRGKATASVIATKPSTCLVVEDSLKFLSENNDALMEIARILARRVDRLTQDLVDELDDNNSSYLRNWI